MDLVKLLVVDDSKTFNNMVSALFQNLGYEVEQAFTLEESKAKLVESSVDYIILDLNLDDGSGEELVEDIKNSSPSSKIIVMTADENTEYRDRIFEKGIIDYFLKTTPIKVIVNSSHSIIQTLQAYKNSNILTIDDSKFVRGFLKNILESKGYGVVEASNAKEGLEALKENSIDLILLDLIMPGINGIKFLEEIKSNPEYFDIPVIIISADQSRENYARVLKQGANDFIKKPFIVEDVLLKCDIHIKSFRSQKHLLDHKEEMLKQETFLELSKKKVSEHTKYNKILLEASRDPFIILSNDGKIIELNTSAVDTFKKEREKMLGSSFDSHFLEPELIREIHTSILQERETADLPLKFKNANGEIKEAFYQGSVYINEEEKVSHTFITLRDVKSYEDNA